MPDFDYCCEVWNSLGSVFAKRLQKRHSRCDRVIMRCKIEAGLSELVCNIKMFLFWSDSIYHSMKISKKEWILIKLYFSFFFNFWKLSNLLSFGSPLAPVFPWFGISFYVDSGTHDIRLDLSRSFYLCKFSFVVHAKCFSPAFCMNYEAKFTEVKQARWVKLEFTCSWI